MSFTKDQGAHATGNGWWP